MSDDNPLFELSAITIYVTDLQKARDFYQGILGLTALHEQKNCLVFQCAGTNRIVVRLADPYDAGETCLVGRFTGLTFTVKNMYQTYKYLEGKGEVLAGPPEKKESGGSFALVYDPDKNSLLIEQLVVRAAGAQKKAPPEKLGKPTDFASKFDDVYDRAMQAMEDVEQKIADMESRNAVLEQLSERDKDEEAERKKRDKEVDQELEQLKKKSAKKSSAKPRLVVDDSPPRKRQLPAVIKKPDLDKLPVRVKKKK